jgi:hypothetical protein
MAISESGLTMTGRIDRKTYSTEKLKSEYPGWDSMSDGERLEAIRRVEPEESDTSYNVTVSRFHEYLVDNLDPDNTNSEANLSAAWMALGTDSASGTSVSDTDLNNRVFSKKVTDHADNGAELLASTFVSSTDANGQTLNEIGLYTGDPVNLGTTGVFLINHATFSDVVKDENRTITFDVTLTFSDT